MSFRPEVNQTLIIDGLTYLFTEHPAAPGMPYGQTGRRATVYQVQTDGIFHALKVFTPAFRSSRVAQTAARLQSFAALPGLQVCDRTVLTPEHHRALLAQQPDLAYAVLMPWVAGETWQELLLGRQPFTPEQSLALACTFANILATMERQGLAHCDLSGPNLIIQLSALSVTLVDVEELYVPGLTRPEKLPGGSEGYAHKIAPQGLWSAEADRFAGAVLLAEMLGWCDENIRQIAYSEQVFDPAEMQQNSERYQRLLAVLRERWGEAIADTFARAWHSETLMDCPTLATWARHLAALPGVTTTTVTAPGTPITGGGVPSPRERLVRGKVDSAEAWLELDDADKALAELEEAMRLAPELAAPVVARAYLKRGTQKEQTGDLSGALMDYQTALSHAPTEGLQDELRAIIAEVEAQLAPPEPPVSAEPHCSQCNRAVQAEWIRCPYCGEALGEEEVVEAPQLEFIEKSQAAEITFEEVPMTPSLVRSGSGPKRRIPGWAWAVGSLALLAVITVGTIGLFRPRSSFPTPAIFTSTPNPTASGGIAETTIAVVVSAHGDWQDTDLYVQKGQIVQFHTSGEWCWGWTVDCSSPEGTPGRPNADECCATLKTEPFGKLIGRIGSWMFPIGGQATVTASESGEIQLRMNDRIGYYEDNTGSLFVEIITSTSLEEVAAGLPEPDPLPPFGLGGGTGRLAFFSYRDGNDEVYLINADGSGLTRLTTSLGYDKSPLWSPDGRSIAFTSVRYGGWDIWMMDADGSKPQRLTFDGAEKYPDAWSPDGNRIAVVSKQHGTYDVFILDMVSGEMSPLVVSSAVDVNAAWSPDGSRISFVSNVEGTYHLYVIGVDGTNRKRLTPDGTNIPYGTPSWSPDGRMIAFSWNGEIYMMDANGSNWQQLTDASYATAIAPAFSPDGRWIAFVSNRAGNNDIYIMSLEDGRVIQLTDDPSNDEHPIWQPALH